MRIANEDPAGIEDWLVKAGAVWVNKHRPSRRQRPIHFQAHAAVIADLDPTILRPHDRSKARLPPEMMGGLVSIGTNCQEDHPPIAVGILNQVSMTSNLERTVE